MRLHWRLILIRRGVGHVDLHRSAGEGGVEIADRAVRRRLYGVVRTAIAGIDGGSGRGVQIEIALRWRIVDAYHRGGAGRLFERICDDEGNGKAEIRHLVVVERWHRARKAVRQVDGAKWMLRRRIV